MNRSARSFLFIYSLLCLLFCTHQAVAQLAGYGYVRPIVIDHRQVPNSDQANFPVLVSIAGPGLATVANGGHVQSGSGYDIVFTSDAAGQIRLDHQIDSYNASTGSGVFWVRIPTLSHSTDTNLYVWYGNSSITTTQENNTGLWQNSFRGVYHFGSAQLSVDATGVNNSSNSGVVTTAGVIGGGGATNGTSAYVSLPSTIFNFPTSGSTSTYTLSFQSWFRTSSSGVILGQDNGVLPGGSPGGYAPAIYVDTAGRVRASMFWHGSTSSQLVSSAPVNDNKWHHVFDTFNNGVETLYVDGVQQGTQNTTQTSYASTYGYFEGAGYTSTWPSAVGGWSYLNGAVDEVRVSSVARSADWIKTEYNNESSPSSFAAVCAEQSASTQPQACALMQPVAAYSYRRAFKFDHSQVLNSDQSDFPALLSGAFSFLAGVSSGGSLQNANGYDVIFTSDPQGLNRLDHEIESYDSSSGAAAFWVRIPNLSHSADTTIYMWYGSSNISWSQENKAGVWRNGYSLVHHYGNGTVLNLIDSTANSNSTTSVGIQAGSGKINGGASFPNVVSNYLRVTSSPSIKPTSAITLEAWGNPVNNGSQSWGNLVSMAYRSDSTWNAPNASYGLWLNNTSPTVAFDVVTAGVAKTLISANSIQYNQWNHLAATYDGSVEHLYINAVQDPNSVAASGSIDYGTSGDLAIGLRSPTSQANPWNGLIDEVRISSVARSADWIRTEYQNQIAPSSFSSVGLQQPASMSSVGIDYMSPALARVGTQITITGFGFGSTQGSSTVTFGGVVGVPASWSDSQIVVAIPSGVSLGNSSVVVTVGGASSNAAVLVVYDPSPSAFGSVRAIQISHSLVPNTDQTDFPVLISGTYSYLANVANGGKLQSANGYDIIFTSDAAGTSQLDHEIDQYNSTTGAISAWVRIPTLSHATDTTIYMWYGNSAGFPSLQNKAGVWRNGYSLVHHYGNGTVLNLMDSTANSNSTTSVGIPAGLGKISGGASFPNVVSNYLRVTSSPSIKPTSAITLEAWGNPVNNGTQSWGNLVSMGYRADSSWSAPNAAYALSMNNTSPTVAFGVAIGGIGKSVISATGLQYNQWSHVAGTYDGAVEHVFINGVQDSNSTATTGSIDYGTSGDLAIGLRSPTSQGNPWNGLIDEVRISSVARSADWIRTEYNNQSSPTAFYLVCAEQHYGDSPIPCAIPVLSSMSPNSGIAGDAVTILGTGFGSSQGGTVVKFNGATATASSWSDGQIVVTVPAAATTGPVVLAMPGYTSNSLQFTVLPMNWGTADIGSVSLPGTVTDTNGTYTVTGSGADIWGSSDSFRFVYQQITGDVEVTARVVSQQNTDLWAKAGVLIRDSLDPAAIYGGALVTPGNGILMLGRTGFNCCFSNFKQISGVAPRWVRAVKQGAQVATYSSTDGINWTQLSIQSIGLHTTSYVGLGVASHTTGLNTTTFDNVTVTPLSGLVSPIVHGDVGTVPSAGAAGVGNSATYVSGSGADVWNSPDTFHYVSQPWTGDLDARLKITGHQYTGDWAKSGLMIRETLAPNSTHVSCFDSPRYGLTAQFRTTTGGNGNGANDSPTTIPSDWCRITRIGNIFNVFGSSDGTTWFPLATTTIAMTSTVNVGFAVDSWAGTNPTLNLSSYESLQLTIPANVPSAAISSPAEGTVVYLPAGTSVTATATPAGANSIQKIELYRVGPDGNPVQVGQGNGSSLTIGTSNLPDASTTALYAVATDSAGQLAVSAPIHVVVTSVPSNWSSTSVHSSGGSATYLNGTWTVHATDGQIDYSNLDAFQFESQQWSGDVDISGRIVSSGQGAGDEQSGFMLRQDLSSPGAIWVGCTSTYGGALRLRARTTANSSPVLINSVQVGTPYWCRLTKQGNTIKAYTSTDGNAWSFFGSVPNPFTDPFYVGLAAAGSWSSSNTDTGVFDNVAISNSVGGIQPSITSPFNGTGYQTAPTSVSVVGQTNQPTNTIDLLLDGSRVSGGYSSPYSADVSIPQGTHILMARAVDSLGVAYLSAPIFVSSGTGFPTPWNQLDIGSVRTAGSASFNGTAGMDVANNNGDIWGSSDNFHYLYEPWTGDVDVIARITSQTNTSSWAKGGLMIRESLNADSAYAFCLLSPGNGVNAQYRASTGSSAAGSGKNIAASAPYWCRIVRNGDNVLVLSSANGQDWTLVTGLTIPMAQQIYVGVANSSQAGGVNTLTFDNFAVAQALTTGAPIILGLSKEWANPGENVTLYGDKFGTSQGTSSLSMGGLSANVQSWSNNVVVAQVPPTIRDAGTSTLQVPASNSDLSYGGPAANPQSSGSGYGAAMINVDGSALMQLVNPAGSDTFLFWPTNATCDGFVSNFALSSNTYYYGSGGQITGTAYYHGQSYYSANPYISFYNNGLSFTCTSPAQGTQSGQACTAPGNSMGVTTSPGGSLTMPPVTISWIAKDEYSVCDPGVAASLTVKAPECKLSISPASLRSDINEKAKANLSCSQLQIGATVPITNPGGGLTFPTSVSIPAGQSSVTFEVTATSGANGPATLNASIGYPSASANVSLINASTDSYQSPGYCKECAAMAGHPIDVTTGNTWLDATDYSLPGLGGGITLTRTWNSLWRPVPVTALNGGTYYITPENVGTFGDSWRSTYEERVQPVSGDTTHLRYWRADGSMWLFKFIGNTWALEFPSDEHASMSFDTSTTLFTLTFLDGSVHTFNNAGYLIAMRDRNGNTTNVNYDGNNRISTVTDAANRVLTFNYIDQNTRQASSIQDAVGVIATYGYDSHANLTSVIYADGRSVGYTYDDQHLLISAVDSQGIPLETHTYDAKRRGLTSSRDNGVESVTIQYPEDPRELSSGFVSTAVNGVFLGAGNGPQTYTTTVTNSRGLTRSYIWGMASTGYNKIVTVLGAGCVTCGATDEVTNAIDALGNKVGVADAANNQAIQSFDWMGNVIQRTQYIDSNTPVVSSYSYNNFGELLTSTDPLNNMTTNQYDAVGNLTQVTSPAPSSGVAASVTKFQYGAGGLLKTITDPLNHATNLTYNSVGLLNSVQDAGGSVTSYEYDSRGNRTAVIDNEGHRTEFEYDPRGRVTKITYPDQTFSQVGYDYRGRRSTVTDQNGKTTTYAYDTADRLISVTDAAQHVTQYAYDAEDDLTSITDALNRQTSFVYDPHGWVTQTTFPSSLIETYGYDTIGNLKTKTDRKQQTITYNYDGLNRLTSKVNPDSTSVGYSYDLGSRMTQVTDPTGTYGFSYDSMGRLTGATTQYSFLPGQTFNNTYSYDAASNRLSLQSPEGSTSYAYDQVNRLTDITSSWAGHFGFGYDDLSRRTSLTRPNGQGTSYSYDSVSHLLSVLHGPTSAPTDGASYTYDNAGNRTSKQNARTGVQDGYTYDDIYELTKVVQAANTTEQYSYDQVGNRLSDLTSSGWTYNLSNQLGTTPSTTFSYDNNGNTISKVDANGTTGFTWDFENRLTQVTLPVDTQGNGGGVVSFKYDSFGRRIQKSAPSATTNFVYDGANIVAEYDGSGAMQAKYAQGAGIDEPLAMNRQGSTVFYNADGLGSIVSLVDGSGAQTNTYTYDAFGKRTNTTGTLFNPFQYTGREWDSETGLYYYRARYYDPSSGRFVTEDPIGIQGGLNLYQYVRNRPVTYIDQLGLAPQLPCPCSDKAPQGLEKAKTCCANTAPLSADDPGANPYASCQAYAHVNAAAMYRFGGNGPWGQIVRSCLLCALKNGAPMHEAHLYCYSRARERVGYFYGTTGFGRAVVGAVFSIGVQITYPNPKDPTMECLQVK